MNWGKTCLLVYCNFAYLKNDHFEKNSYNAVLFSLCSVNPKYSFTTDIKKKITTNNSFVFFFYNGLHWITKVHLFYFTTRTPNQFAPLQNAFPSRMDYGIWEAYPVVQSLIFFF